MNGTELGALRRLLLFSAAEAARWIAADDLRPHGVEERTWNRWESGKVPVPENIARQLVFLAAWRAEIIATLSSEVAHLWHATQRPVALVWYAEAEDFAGAPERWRPHCSALATMLDKSTRREVEWRIDLVPFDPGPFNRWRAALGLVDDLDARSRWAEEQAAHPLRAKDRAA